MEAPQGLQRGGRQPLPLGARLQGGGAGRRRRTALELVHVVGERSLPCGGPDRLQGQVGDGEQREQGHGDRDALAGGKVREDRQRGREQDRERPQAKHGRHGEQHQGEHHSLDGRARPHERQVVEVVEEEPEVREKEQRDGRGDGPEQRRQPGARDVPDEGANRPGLARRRGDPGAHGRERRERVGRLARQARPGERQVRLWKVRGELDGEGGVIEGVVDRARLKRTLRLADLGDCRPRQVLDAELEHRLPQRLSGQSRSGGILLPDGRAPLLPELPDAPGIGPDRIDGALQLLQLLGTDRDPGHRARRGGGGGGRPAVGSARVPWRWSLRLRAGRLRFGHRLAGARRGLVLRLLLGELLLHQGGRVHLRRGPDWAQCEGGKGGERADSHARLEC